MSRNFGLGSRVMKDAGRMGLHAAAKKGEMSFASAATNSARWSKFCTWSALHGVKRMEHITTDLVKNYGYELARRVKEGDLRPSTGQTYLSVVNTMMKLVTKWDSVSPTKDCQIAKRSNVRVDAPSALDTQKFDSILAEVKNEMGERAGIVVELARDFGLRSKEASLFDARAALKESKKTGFVTIVNGTKGGRKRTFQLSARQVLVLERAVAIQGSGRAVMDPEVDWETWREGELRDARELVQKSGGGLHDLRAAYACQRYLELTGYNAPCTGAEIQNRILDLKAREVISEELGHSRIDVVASYVGGRR